MNYIFNVFYKNNNFQFLLFINYVKKNKDKRTQCKHAGF